MVDLQVRLCLRTSFSQLVEGQITTDEFSKTFWEWENFPDEGVAEIARFGWCLYDDFWPIRLQGRNGLSPENRKIAERCLLFLGTNLEFRWPRIVDHPWRWLLITSLFIVPATPGIILGFGAFILAATLVSSMGWSALWVVLIGLAFLTPSIGLFWLCFRYDQRQQQRQWQEYCRNGDWQVWPFFTDAEYQAVSHSAKNPQP